MKLTVEVVMLPEANGPLGEAACHHEPVTDKLQHVIDRMREEGAMVEGMGGIFRNDAGRLCGQWKVMP